MEPNTPIDEPRREKENMTGPQEEYITDQSVPSVSQTDSAPTEAAGRGRSETGSDLEEPGGSARGIASRISVSGEGVGEIDTAMLERRARELARIDGRSEPGDHDFVRAEEDLLHPGIPPAPEEGEEPVKLWSEGIGTQGHQAETFLVDDEENAASALVAEGVQEADHERRLAASESSLDDEEGADESDRATFRDSWRPEDKAMESAEEARLERIDPDEVQRRRAERHKNSPALNPFEHRSGPGEQEVS